MAMVSWPDVQGKPTHDHLTIDHRTPTAISVAESIPPGGMRLRNETVQSIIR